MSELTLAGDRPRSQDIGARRVIREWWRRLIRGGESIASVTPFGDNLSDEEFAFCLLLIAAHL